MQCPVTANPEQQTYAFWMLKKTLLVFMLWRIQKERHICFGFWPRFTYISGIYLLSCAHSIYSKKNNEILYFLRYLKTKTNIPLFSWGQLIWAIAEPDRAKKKDAPSQNCPFSLIKNNNWKVLFFYLDDVWWNKKNHDENLLL